MPTYAWLARFRTDFLEMTSEQQAAFISAVAELAEDLGSGGAATRKGLRAKGFQGAFGIFEMTFAADGRATFAYGDEVRLGEAHIVWRRVGTHGIFKRP